MPSIGFCWTPLSSVGRRDADHLVERRHDVDDVQELAAQAALVLDPRRPGHDHRVARAAEVAGDLLGPLERRVHRVRPGGREVVEVLRPAELVDHLQVVLPLLREAVEEQVLVDRAFDAPLGAGAVVAGDVDEDRVVGAGQLLHGVDDPAHVVIDVRAVGGEHLHHPGVEPLLVGVERVPRRQARRPRRELRAGRDDAELLLPLERLLAVLVPAHVELALELVDPLRGRVVRRVRRAGRDVQEERPVRGDALDLAHPGDGLVGEVGRQVVVRVGRGRDEVPVLVQHRVPVVHVAGVEAVEVVEPEAIGPAVERAGGARLPGRRVVVLADPGGHVPVLPQHLADGAGTARQHARCSRRTPWPLRRCRRTRPSGGCGR